MEILLSKPALSLTNRGCSQMVFLLLTPAPSADFLSLLHSAQHQQSSDNKAKYRLPRRPDRDWGDGGEGAGVGQREEEAQQAPPRPRRQGGGGGERARALKIRACVRTISPPP